VSAARIIAQVAVLLLTACGTLEDNAWTSGVRPEDARDIKRAVCIATKATKVYQYTLEDDGSISVSTDDGIYIARRFRGKWTFERAIVVI
jgi:hypothetical protein